jgi:hypothetical protein
MVEFIFCYEIFFRHLRELMVEFIFCYEIFFRHLRELTVEFIFCYEIYICLWNLKIDKREHIYQSGTESRWEHYFFNHPLKEIKFCWYTILSFDTYMSSPLSTFKYQNHIWIYRGNTYINLQGEHIYQSTGGTHISIYRGNTYINL